MDMVPPCRNIFWLVINVSRFPGGAASALVLFALGCSGAPPALPGPESRIATDIEYLASPALGGRAAGSPGSAGTARFLAERYTELGLAGAFPGKCATLSCAPVYAQPFSVETGGASNIAAVLPGSDPRLRGTWVVIGGHRDHIGQIAKYARDPERGMVIRPGADDNASGTAAMLEVARRLAANPPPRSILFVHFDAEEMGLIGSHKFVKESPIPLDSVVVMINLDMVGRLRKDELTVDVPPNGERFLGLIDSLAAAGRLHLLITGAFSERSDHGPFDQAMVPAFALSTGLHDDYHTSMDLPVRVNMNGVLRIADLVEQLARLARPRL
jgi:hypothetical protein